MTRLFADIEQLIPKLEGWCSVQRAQLMAATVLALRPKLSVLLGIWGGRDTFALALAHKEVRSGTVMAIDPWSKDASVEGQLGEHRDFWGKVDHESVRTGFMRKKAELRLDPWIGVIRDKSDNVQVPNEIGILCIDGNHSDQAVRDTQRFAPVVIKGGIVFCDDIRGGNGKWDGPRKSVAVLESLGFKRLYDVDDGTVFQRV